MNWTGPSCALATHGFQLALSTHSTSVPSDNSCSATSRLLRVHQSRDAQLRGARVWWDDVLHKPGNDAHLVKRTHSTNHRAFKV
eukprot:169303-Amphidinium_carterae.1